MRKPFSEHTMDELYEEIDMKCGICNGDMELELGLSGDHWVCPHCEPHDRVEKLEEVYNAARTYVALRNESGYDVQRERTAAWEQLQKAVMQVGAKE